MIRRLLCLLVLWPAVASAQTGPCPDPCELKPNQAISASFTHPGSVAGAVVSGYRLYLAPEGGAPVQLGSDIALSALQNGAVLVPVTAPATLGRYELIAAAFNSFGEGRSAPAAFSVNGPPSPPGKPTLFIAITVAADGKTLQLQLVDISQVK